MTEWSPIGSRSAPEPAIIIDGNGVSRTNEPITIGVPFPKGYCASVEELTLQPGPEAAAPGVPFQARILDRWSDRSIRWLLVDFRASVPATGSSTYRFARHHAHHSGIPDEVRLLARQGSDGVSVDTGAAKFELRRDGWLACRPNAEPGRGATVGAAARLEITGADGQPLPVVFERVACEEEGPLRLTVLAEGRVVDQDRQATVELFARFHFFAESAAVRVVLTLRNPRRAEHTGGYWELGDPGSIVLKSASYVVSITDTAGEAWTPVCSPEERSPLEPAEAPLELYQASSGGDRWRSRNHVNARGELPMQFRGYRLSTPGGVREGQRASPVAGLSARETTSPAIAITLRDFWPRFPKAVRSEGHSLSLDLLPAQWGDLHEIQGGEQLTEELVVTFADDPVTRVPLDWARNPARVSLEPSWCAYAQAMPYLVPADEEPPSAYSALTSAAVEGSERFELKRERIDEYGWRNSGELYADHEAVGHSGSDALISHYNNQYDAIAGFARQFLRSGDHRWFALADRLARHVIDIDIYHTDSDKAAYNRGLFWHTDHYTDAGLSTHRTYPRGSAGSGGPSAEHNYNTGLMIYYFMTGDPGARAAAVDLGQWVIDMDDGAKSRLRWISKGRTGLASASGSSDYHGPGRASGNSIVALINAFRLTGESRYLEKAEELIRRCTHPAEDIDRLKLLDAERRWFYTVFLQAVGSYLDLKAERDDLDDMYAYARLVLLQYARWMTLHEYPYLEKPEILAFPNETWAAQDMRKSDVFKHAARHVEGPERERFLERSRFFFDYSVSTLTRAETRTLTRPVVLMLTNGYVHAFFETGRWGSAPAPRRTSMDFRTLPSFVPQKQLALRRLVVAAIVVGLLGGFSLLVALW